jgi:hypothetical protein
MTMYEDNVFYEKKPKSFYLKNPRGGEIFRACPDRPWGPPSLLYNGYQVFLRGKVRPGRAADHSRTSSVEVMEE